MVTSPGSTRTYYSCHPAPNGDPEGFWLVVWNMNFMTFHILGIIIPTDELIFFRGVGIPPTR